MEATFTIEEVIRLCQSVYSAIWSGGKSVLHWLSEPLEVIRGFATLIDLTVPEWVDDVLGLDGVIDSFRQFAANEVAPTPIAILFGVGLITFLIWGLVKFIWPNS